MRKSVTGVFMAAAFILCVAPLSAQDARFCVKKQNGQMRAVGAGESCLASEAVMQLGSSGVAGGNALHLVDATGQDFGAYRFIVQQPGIQVPRPGHDGQWVNIPVISLQGPQLLSLFYYFKTPCPADGSFHAPSERWRSGMLYNELVRDGILDGDLLFYPGDQIEQFKAGSVEGPNWSTGERICTNMSEFFPGGPHVKLEAMPAPVMVPPFRLVLK